MVQQKDLKLANLQLTIEQNLGCGPRKCTGPYVGVHMAALYVLVYDLKAYIGTTNASPLSEAART